MALIKQNGIMDDFPGKRENKEKDPQCVMFKTTVMLFFFFFTKPSSSKSYKQWHMAVAASERTAFKICVHITKAYWL